VQFIKLTFSFILGLTSAFGLWYGNLQIASHKSDIATISHYNLWEYRAKLLKSAASPKMVICGGSNVLFSTRACKLEEAFDLPVVNAGFNASTSFKFLTWLLKPYLKKGDILLMPLEYNLYRDSGSYIYYNDRELSLSYYPEYYQEMDTFLWVRTLLSHRYWHVFNMRMRLGLPTYGNKFALNMNHYNSNGDYVNNLRKKESKELKARFRTELLKEFTGEVMITAKSATWKEIEMFSHWCKKKQISLYFTWPSLLKNSNYPNYAHFNQLISLIERKLKSMEITMLGKPENSFYSEEYFFDTIYHMNEVGAAVRTQQLIHLLKPFFGNTSLPDS
jgi:hypothetical protein